MQNQQYYFKIPFQEQQQNQKDVKLNIVSIIDCSGSMEMWWDKLAEFYNSDCIPKQNCTTITFHTTARIENSNNLNPDILFHGGGNTNISEAFTLFEQVVAKIPKDEPITAIFISDGQDFNIKTLDERLKKLKGNSTGRHLNFICLGIQDEFPTFISMNLRQLYHKGDNSIPALFLIEFVSEKAFFNKFEGMKQYFYKYGQFVQLDPPANLYIWDESVVDSAYENSWIIAKTKSIMVNNKVYDTDKTELTAEDLVDIFRGWVQQLQLVSLSDLEEAKKNAIIAIKEMTRLVEEISKRVGFDICKCKDVNKDNLKNESFFNRCIFNFVFRYGNKIQWFLEEVKNLADGKSPIFQDEFEAAKRMNIGTITGKYHQKALALKALTPEEFQNIKKEFIINFNKLNVLSKKKNNPEIQKIQEENQQQQQVIQVEEAIKPQGKDILSIFQEANFLKSFEYLKNPFDLFETFPLYGLPIRVKRFEGANENPWLIEIKWIPEQPLEQIDLAELTKSLFNIELKVLGQENNKEEVNCILPLFSKELEGFSPILNSRLFKVMMSYTVMQNADIICSDSYISLISSAVAYLFKQKQSKQRDDMIQACFISLRVCYGEVKLASQQQQQQQLLEEQQQQPFFQDQDLQSFEKYSLLLLNDTNAALGFKKQKKHEKAEIDEENQFLQNDDDDDNDENENDENGGDSEEEHKQNQYQQNYRGRGRGNRGRARHKKGNRKVNRKIGQKEKLANKMEYEKQQQEKLSLDLQNPIFGFGKPFIHALYLLWIGQIDKKQTINMVEKLFLHYFALLLQKINFFKLVKLNLSKEILQQMKQKFLQKIDTYFSISEFRNDFQKEFMILLNQTEMELNINQKNFEDVNSKLPLSVIQGAFEFFIEKKYPQSELIFLIYHAFIHKTPQCFVQEINKNAKEITLKVMEKEITPKTLITIPGFSEFYKSIDDEYAKIFAQRHFDITPLSKQKLQDLCKQKNIDFNLLQFQEATGLCKVACVSEKCPFFLQVKQQFKLHMDNWQGKLPLGFHGFVKARVQLEVEEIYEKAVAKWKKFPNQYNVDKQFVINYITKLKTAYIQMQ